MAEHESAYAFLSKLRPSIVFVKSLKYGSLGFCLSKTTESTVLTMIETVLNCVATDGVPTPNGRVV